ncbi:MAG: MoaD/ThiS family protein [Caulobacterales bacterium]
MVHVVAAGGDYARFTGGTNEFEVAAATVREMILALEAQYPGLGDYVESRMAIAIDGEIHQDAWGETLGQASEVYLIPKIGGG